jgi:hypothetical protein
MRKVLLAISALFILTSSSQSKEIQGEMRCKVKSNYVVQNEEGNPKVFSGYEDSFTKGDTLYFKFKIPSYNKKGTHFELTDGKDEEENSAYFKGKPNILSSLLGDGFIYKRTKDSGFSIVFKSDFINWDLMLGNLVLSRYYKNDWSGILVKYYPPAMSAQIATLDCRQSSDRVDEFIDYVKKLAK